MVALETSNFLGVGLYTPAEAAFYARVPTSTVSRWVHGTKSGDPALRAQLPGNEERFVTFLDFVQTMAIRSIRTMPREKGNRPVPLEKIRQTVERARVEFGIEFPFARKHTTYLFGDEVFLDIDDVGLVQVTGKQINQHGMRKVIEVYSKDLSFDAAGLARRFNAFQWRDLKVVMDPHIRFGEPVVESCRYTARTLWEASIAEGSYIAAATAFGVSADEVEIACRYTDHLQFPASAA